MTYDHPDRHTDIHDDDIPVGRILTRREMLKLFGGAGITLLASGTLAKVALAQEATPEMMALDCVVRPEMTEGPYFVDTMLERSDIRADTLLDIVKAGVPLSLKLVVYDVTDGQCAPLEGVQVDIWQCDALGTYSAVEDAGFETLEENWLRGYQITDEEGMVEFMTIYPGWYSGRTVHVHVKIRTEPESEEGYEFTSQFYFDDELSDMIHAMEPYSEITEERDTYNDTDMHYDGETGDMMLLTLEEADEESDAAGGYTAVFSIGLDLSDEEVGASDSDSMTGGGDGPGGPGGAPPGGGNGEPPPQTTEEADA